MRAIPVMLAPLLLVLLVDGVRAADEPPIDVARGKQLLGKFQAGETLTPDEQAYLDRVKQAIRKRAAGQRPGPAPNTPARPFVVNTSDWVQLVPITDMTAPYKGEDGGLYGGGGQNELPAAHRAAYLKESERIRPLDANGQPSDDGKIGLISIGFSNTAIEWEDKDTWPTLAKRIEAAGLSPAQVQAVWVKHVEANPKPLGDFPAHALALQADITAILNIARHYYPNLSVAYVSSRTFGGWSGRASGSPEPYAYESGFGTRWVVQNQIQGDSQLNYDPARGAVKAPLVLWGPYLWACGNTPRKFDGLTWTQNDVRADQLHPNEAGCRKTTSLLLNFFKIDAGASRWFLRPGEQGKLTPLPKSTFK